MALPFLSINRRLLIFLFAIFLAIIAVILVRFYLSNMEARIAAKYADNREEVAQVVVPVMDLEAGSVVDMESFALRSIEFDVIPPDAVHPDDFEQALGQTIKLDIPKGRVLQWGYLSSGIIPAFSEQLDKDQRALTIAVDEINSISGMLRPNDRIDLFVILDNVGADQSDKNQKMVVPLLQSILVKATGNITRREILPGTNAPVERSYATLTLDLLPNEIGKVLLAQEKGALKAVLKRPDQTGNAEYVMTSEDDLLGNHGDSGINFAIEAYVGGKQGGIISPVRLNSTVVSAEDEDVVEEELSPLMPSMDPSK